jgi:DNA-binding NarL/FixJ family response regulator
VTFSVSARPIRVLLVDDHRAVLWGLAKLVESAGPSLQLAATATCCADALAAARLHRPDVVLLDLDLGERNAVDIIPELAALAGTKVLVLTGSADNALYEAAVFAGARGVVHKSDAAEQVLKAISTVHAGEVWLNRAVLGQLLATLSGNHASPSRPATCTSDALTPAERKVIAEVVQRRSAPNKVIAAALQISTHTLRNHLSSIYSKLSLNRRLDLVLYAIEHKLVAAPQRA